MKRFVLSAVIASLLLFSLGFGVVTQASENFDRNTIQNAVGLDNTAASYIGNSNSMKFHYAGCTWVSKMNPSNKVPFASREDAINAGYVPCKVCRP